LLALDRGPGRNPLVVWDAVFASIRAGGLGRLPEMDRVDVRARLGGVVLRARAGLQGFHLSARLGVDGRLAEEQSLLGLNFAAAASAAPRSRRTASWSARTGP